MNLQEVQREELMKLENQRNNIEKEMTNLVELLDNM